MCVFYIRSVSPIMFVETMLAVSVSVYCGMQTVFGFTFENAVKQEFQKDL